MILRLQNSLRIFLLAMAGGLNAQDIPLFSQKLTNSLIYNPSLAGHTAGSVTTSYKQAYAQVEDAPVDYLLSVHTPLANYRFGMGLNIYQEEVNFMRNMFASAAFAYHVHLNTASTLSFGVAGEYNTFGASKTPDYREGSLLNDREWINLVNGRTAYADFSFGMHFQNRFLKAGVSSNRMATAWLKEKNRQVLSSYFSASLQGILRLGATGNQLEPYITFRKLSELNKTVDAGLYYTYREKLITGLGYRSGKVLSTTLGFWLAPQLMAGYSHEIVTGIKGLGPTSEITFRYDFKNKAYKSSYVTEYRAAYLASLAYRRKLLNASSSKGARNPEQLGKKEKRSRYHTPNRRYQNLKKFPGKGKRRIR